MPALDYCHPQIVHALEKDGWTVRDKPLEIDTAERTVFIDIEARKLSNGTSQHILLAEIKCFPDRDRTTRDLYIALGQYIVYQAVLDERELSLPLFLAIPEAVYHSTVFDPAVQRAIRDRDVMVLVVDLAIERIVQWIK